MQVPGPSYMAGTVARRGEFVEDRALRPVVAMAMRGQALQRGLHGVHFRDLLVEFADVLQREISCSTTGPASILP